MSARIFAALLLTLGIVLTASAANVITLGLNFYSENPGEQEIKVDGTLPDGVTMGKKIRFINPKLKGYCFPVRIDLDKTGELDAKFVVTGGTGRVSASLSYYTRNPETKKSVPASAECTMFEFCDEPSPVAPCTFKGWKRFSSVNGVKVSPGDVITVRLALKAPAAE